MRKVQWTKRSFAGSFRLDGRPSIAGSGVLPVQKAVTDFPKRAADSGSGRPALPLYPMANIAFFLMISSIYLFI
jgi:hypothetical protein